MRSYPKLRKTIKWGGAGITVLLVVIWAASLRWQVSWVSRARPVVITGVVNGMFMYTRVNIMPPKNLQSGWRFEHVARAPEWRVQYERSPALTSVLVVVLLPAAFTLSASLIAWRLDVVARRRSGVCIKCGYSLVGLPAGSTCPECGRPGAGSLS